MSDRHVYKALSGPYAGRTPPPRYRGGGAFSDAVVRRCCPHCGSKPGFYCETPHGEKAWPPHRERLGGGMAAHRVRSKPKERGARGRSLVGAVLAALRRALAGAANRSPGLKEPA